MIKLRILITGALGYVATSILELLSKSNKFEIIGTDNQFNDRVSWLIKNDIKFFQRDLFNIRDLLRDLLSDIDYVIHTASVTSVPTTLEQSSPEIDKQIYRVCVDGTREIINNIKDNTKIIFFSSHTVFDGLKSQAFNLNEDFPPIPLVAYSCAKVANERDLFNSNKNFIILRLGSVTGYGHNQRINIVGNLFARRTSQNLPIKLFGGGHNVKPLVCLSDVARCIEFFLYHEHFNKQIYHLVSENLKVSEIAAICKKYNPNLIIEETIDKIPNLGYSLCNTKLLSTGFRFQETIDESIGKMISAWSNKNKNE